MTPPVRSALVSLALLACQGASPPPAPAPDVPPTDAPASDVPASDAPASDVPAAVVLDGGDVDAGASTMLTLDYGRVFCADVEAVASNDGGIRVNEVCDQGVGATPRYLTLRGCVLRYTADDRRINQVAQDGTYLGRSRHPIPMPGACANFVTLYPIEQVRHAVWCALDAARCAEDGTVR